VQAPDLHTHSYSKLHRGFIVGAVFCSVLPLLLLGWVSFLNYSEFSISKMSDYFKGTVEDSRKIVGLFLDQRVSDLKLVAFTHSLGFLADTSNLSKIFNVLNANGSNFTDLGIIGTEGKHIAYIGPYDLMDKDYSGTFWFREVLSKGIFISDMFLGFRDIPHFIIAVLQSKEDKTWILRATVNSEFLNSLVDTATLGQTGEVFLVNQEGVFQTTPRFKGKIMEKASLPMNLFTGESGILISDGTGLTDSFSPETSLPIVYRIKISLMPDQGQQIVAYSRLKHPDWFLVVKRDFWEFFGDIDQLNIAILVLLHVSIIAVLVVSAFTARYMIKVIEKRDKEAERLSRQLMQARKLASIGELATGVAHEINNPLAVILTESMVMRELTEDEKDLNQQYKTHLTQSLSQIDGQVERCTHITGNLLRFSRRVSSASEFVDLNVVLADVVGFVERKATSCNVNISLHLQQNLPQLRTNRFELEEVFLNLINNAIDAHEGIPSGSVNIIARLDSLRNGLVVTVGDTGSGIADENLERLFDPFFTTKPAGKGTGLGLSISYSIIKHISGDISVQSKIGKGTTFTLFFPLPTTGQSHKEESAGDSRKDNPG
jgi:two-component system NtrC family sensor kinase